MNQCVILVGGKGTRLGILTADEPKPMINVGGEPFILGLISEITRYGFKEILLLCGHLAEKIYPYFDGMKINGAIVRCIIEPEQMGTGGALLNALHMLEDEFLLFNGDSYFDFNYLDLQTIPSSKGWLGKMALFTTPNAGRYGAVSLNCNLITSFSEKGTYQGAGLVNGGVYLLKRKALELGNTIPCSLEQDILPYLASDNKLFGRIYSGYFIDIGIPSDLFLAKKELPNKIRRSIFFDCDLLLECKNIYTDSDYALQWKPESLDAVKLWNDRGWLVFIYGDKNQIDSLSDAQLAIYDKLIDQLRINGGHIDGCYALQTDLVTRRYTTSLPITSAFAKWPTDAKYAYLISKKKTDLAAGKKFGIKDICFEGSHLLQFCKALKF